MEKERDQQGGVLFHERDNARRRTNRNGYKPRSFNIIPASASKPCYLGYYAHCTFTPISTIICWGFAWGIYRRKLKKR